MVPNLASLQQQLQALELVPFRDKMAMPLQMWQNVFSIQIRQEWDSENLLT